jgi:hypothetical protein
MLGRRRGSYIAACMLAALTLALAAAPAQAANHTVTYDKY